MTNEEAKLLLKDKSRTDPKIDPEQISRLRQDYREAAIGYWVEMGAAMGSAYTGALICDKPTPAYTAATIALVCMGLAWMAKQEMKQAIADLQQHYRR